MIRVLFVCLGNICRSPMAEAVFMHKVHEAGLERGIEADSAGTGHWHIGKPPHAGTREVLAANAIRCDHRARQLAREDLDEFDYVVGMDRENVEDIRAVGTGRANVAPFLGFAPHIAERDVPDPYFTGNFAEVYELVCAASDGLLAAIRRDHNL